VRRGRPPRKPCRASARARRNHRCGQTATSAATRSGWRQRLSVAGALLGEPRLLVLDEPANGLDPEGIRWLRDLLRRFVADGNTVFISSHVLAEIASSWPTTW
jgi:ATPase subunit of ABC transporter with duplicated ATPase domains